MSLRSPHGMHAVGDPSAAGTASDIIPLLRDRPARGDVTTYVCENFACKAPVIGACNSIRAVESL